MDAQTSNLWAQLPNVAPSPRVNLHEHLSDYAKNFNTDLDVLWNQADVDNNGMLDRVECKNFMDQLVRFSSTERA